VAFTVNGTASSSPQADANYVAWLSAATTPATAGIGGSFILTQGRYRPKLQVLVRTDTSIATQRDWVGLTSATMTASDTSNTTRYVGVRYSTAVPDTKWKCASGDGAANSAVDTGVTVAVSTAYLITIDWSVAGTLICSISTNGGTPVTVSKTTNLDAAGTTNLGIMDYLTNTAAAAFTWRTAWMSIETQ
jgi:hypothetical protein